MGIAAAAAAAAAVVDTSLILVLELASGLVLVLQTSCLVLQTRMAGVGHLQVHLHF